MNDPQCSYQDMLSEASAILGPTNGDLLDAFRRLIKYPKAAGTGAGST